MLRYANGIHDYVRDPDKQDRELVRNTNTHTSPLLPKPEIMAECVSGSQLSNFCRKFSAHTYLYACCLAAQSARTLVCVQNFKTIQVLNALQSMQCEGFEVMHSNVRGTSTKVIYSKVDDTSYLILGHG